MLREVTLKSALQSFIDGEDVRVILPMEDFEDRLVPIGKLFNDARFLVDKKAAKTNPEFEAAVQDMVAQSPPNRQTLLKQQRKQRKPLWESSGSLWTWEKWWPFAMPAGA